MLTNVQFERMFPLSPLRQGRRVHEQQAGGPEALMLSLHLLPVSLLNMHERLSLEQAVYRLRGRCFALRQVRAQQVR